MSISSISEPSGMLPREMLACMYWNIDLRADVSAGAQAGEATSDASPLDPRAVARTFSSRALIRPDALLSVLSRLSLWAHMLPRSDRSSCEVTGEPAAPDKVLGPKDAVMGGSGARR